MPTKLLCLLILLAACTAHAKEYGQYDPKRLLLVAETPEGKKYRFDGAYLDQMLNDLASHANNYPPQFDSPQDKQRAIQDVKALSGMLDTLINVPSPNPEFMLRAAHLNSMGHNLDIPGAAEKAGAIFQKHLAARPEDPRGNFLYGVFLGGSGRPKEALPYLEKALSVGVVDAAYAIGMSHLMLGDKAKALQFLESYKRSKPADTRVDTLIDAIRNGKVELKQKPG